MDSAKTSTKQKSRQQVSNELKARVAAIVNQLPANYKAIILLHYNEYDSVAGGQLIDNVRRGRSSDKKLTEILEAIAKKKLTLSTKRIEFLEIVA